MATGVSSWSTTAATNATADSAVNWAEGQAPSSINDSARGLMSSVAKYRDDISGSLTTGGSSTAYTVSTNQGFASLSAMNARVFTIVPHTTCGDAPTLSVDSLTAKQIRTETGVSVASGVMVAGTPYQLVYFSSAGEFILMNFVSNPYIIPVAAGMDWWATTAPSSNFALAYGQAISRSTYSVLFGLVGTTYGTGDGTTTFNIPDKRGRASIGKDDMGGSSANRVTSNGSANSFNGDNLGAVGGSETNAEILTHSHSFSATTSSDGSHDHTYTLTRAYDNTGNTSTTRLGRGQEAEVATGKEGQIDSGGAHTHTLSGTTGNAGSIAAHNIMQPSIVANYIIRII